MLDGVRVDFVERQRIGVGKCGVRIGYLLEFIAHEGLESMDITPDQALYLSDIDIIRGQHGKGGVEDVLNLVVPEEHQLGFHIILR